MQSTTVKESIYLFYDVCFVPFYICAVLSVYACMCAWLFTVYVLYCRQIYVYYIFLVISNRRYPPCASAKQEKVRDFTRKVCEHRLLVRRPGDAHSEQAVRLLQNQPHIQGALLPHERGIEPYVTQPPSP